MSLDVTDATFQTEVVERSHAVPVIVDFWAPWCGPCKSLTPILERATAATEGQVELVKLNIDEFDSMRTYVIDPSSPTFDSSDVRAA